MEIEQLKALAISALEDRKGVDIKVLDVHDKSSVTDVMVVCTGTSNRQVRALADGVVEKAKENGIQPLGVEGDKNNEWVLVDLGDVVVHVMQAETREFYNLEKLWS